MNLLAQITQPHLKKNVPQMRIGDTVRVHQKIKDVDAKGKDRERIQIYEGIVIARKHGSGIEGTFTVRKIAVGGIGVERVFPLHSPNIVKIEQLKSAKVRQSKLYYLRHVKSAAMRLSKEKRQNVVWEEKGAEAEIAALEAETAQVAADNAEMKAEEESNEPVASESSETVTETAEHSAPDESAQTDNSTDSGEAKKE